VLSEPTPEERNRAARLVKRHAHDSRDEAELMAMLGLDHAEPAAPKRPRPHDPLTVTELHDMLAPFADRHTRRPDGLR
jgi:hypothetical protein